MALDPSKIKAFLFDVDGTLRDTDDEYVAKFARLLSPFKFALPNNDVQQAARWLVMQSEGPANIVYGIPDLLGIDPLIGRFSNWLYEKNPEKKAQSTSLIEGVEANLKILKPLYALGVISARGERGTQAFIEEYALGSYFQCVATALTVHRTKPHPAPVYWSAKQLGVNPEECVLIGDTTVDIKAGKSAGAQTIGVLSGFGEGKELVRAGATEIIRSVADLPALLNLT